MTVRGPDSFHFLWVVRVAGTWRGPGALSVSPCLVHPASGAPHLKAGLVDLPATLTQSPDRAPPPSLRSPARGGQGREWELRGQVALASASPHAQATIWPAGGPRAPGNGSERGGFLWLWFASLCGSMCLPEPQFLTLRNGKIITFTSPAMLCELGEF